MNPFALPGSKWFERCRSLLLAEAGCTLVRAGSPSGFDLLVAECILKGDRIAWLWLDEADSGRPERLLTKLREAIHEAAQLFPNGNPDSLAALRERVRLGSSRAEPLTIVVSNAELAPELILELRAAVAEGVSLVLQVRPGGAEEWLPSFAPQRLIAEVDLLLRPGEAADFLPAGDLRPQSRWDAAGGGCALRPLLNALRAQLSRPPLIEPGPFVHATFVDEGQWVALDARISSLVRCGAYVEAFEIALSHRRQSAAAIVSQAAPVYREHGWVDRLRHLIQSLGITAVAESDELLRHLYEHSHGPEELVGVLPLVVQVLQRREAPELRALYAFRLAVPDVVAQTERALRARETPLTLRMHGLALAVHGANERSFEYLGRAQRLAVAVGDRDQSAAVALDLAAAAVRRGSYRQAAGWAGWMLDGAGLEALAADACSLRAQATRCLARLLSEERSELESELAPWVRLVAERPAPSGVPVHALLGHWAVVCGDLAAAEGHYRQRFKDAEPAEFAATALDLLPVLVARGLQAEAAELSERVRAFTGALASDGRLLGELARLLVLDARGAAPERAQLATELVHGLRQQGDAHRAAQAAMHAADALLLQGDPAQAAAILALATSGWQELGGPGWTLRSQACANPQQVRQLSRGFGASPRIQLLGSPCVITASATLPLSERLAECVAILAQHPEGCSLERLALLLYGDSGLNSTTKGVIRRLRHQLPVQARPYRLDPAVTVDLYDLRSALRSGALSEALQHYAGPLLPGSDCRFVQELRLELEESLRRAVMANGSVPDVLLLLERGGDEDLDLLEHAERLLPTETPQSHLLRARIRRVRRDWGLE